MSATPKVASDVVTFPEMLHERGSIGYIEKMLIGELVLLSQPQLVLETGTYRGQTTKFLVDFARANGLSDCRVASFDLPEVVEQVDRSVADDPAIELVPGSLPGTMRRFLERTGAVVDFAIIDADHSYTGVKRDLETLEQNLRPGAYVFAHDYRPHDVKYEGTVLAIRQFVTSRAFDFMPVTASEKDGRELAWGAGILRKPALGEVPSRPRHRAGDEARWIAKRLAKRIAVGRRR